MKRAGMASAALALSRGTAFAQMGGGQSGGMAGGGSGWGTHMNSGWLFGIVIAALVVVAIAVMVNRK